MVDEYKAFDPDVNGLNYVQIPLWSMSTGIGLSAIPGYPAFRFLYGR